MCRGRLSCKGERAAVGKERKIKVSIHLFINSAVILNAHHVPSTEVTKSPFYPDEVK